MSEQLVTAGDVALLRAAWSLGWASPATLAGLALPGQQVATVTRRLRWLCLHGYLRGLRLLFGPAGHRQLYTPGRLAGQVDPGLVDGWRPPLSATAHTVAVGAALLAAHRADLAPPLSVAGWSGEAELRAWAEPGESVPDARVTWVGPGGRGRWLLEVDLGTESRAVWRRKLAGYLDAAPEDTVVALTPGPLRARHIAQLASEVGVALVAAPGEAWASEPGCTVYSARWRRRLPLAEACRCL
ncbi:MAG: replication-relaxation family protein [Mycobacteriales bacterium]